MLSILFFLLAIGALSVYALSNYTSKIGAAVTATTGAVGGLWVDIQTSFSNLVWQPAVSGDWYAMYAMAGIVVLALVMAWNLLLTDFRSAVR